MNYQVTVETQGKCDSVAGSKEDFDDIQWHFEVVRAAGDSILCPLLGFLGFGSISVERSVYRYYVESRKADFSMKYWLRTKSSSHDVQKTFLPYFVLTSSNVLLLVGLLIRESSIWLYLTGLTICMSQGTV